MDYNDINNLLNNVNDEYNLNNNKKKNNSLDIALFQLINSVISRSCCDGHES